MPSVDEKRFWFVAARFPGSKWSASGYMTFTQARMLAEAVEGIGMLAEVREWQVEKVTA